ncbi:uncharacterized protein TNCV_2509331 [Trichonephila clavipes]|nr:uncharacterized protein TNCV_2509331 [Trichonephila clavipes]
MLKISPKKDSPSLESKFRRVTRFGAFIDLARKHLAREAPDSKAIFAVQSVNDNDEITRYQMGRYICNNEAIWRIFSFPIHERDPAVIHLAVYLENGQRIYFTEQIALQQALTALKTTLTEFFNLCNRQDLFGRFAKILIYTNVPKYFTWNKQSKNWEPRRRGIPVPGFAVIFMANTISRLYTIHPKQRECFFLRLLLINVPGPTSFQDLRKINKTLYDTFFDACRELHLLEDDNDWDLTLKDASLSSTPQQIRHLFSKILTTYFPSQASALWNKYNDSMSEDILHRIKNTNQNLNIEFSAEIYN